MFSKVEISFNLQFQDDQNEQQAAKLTSSRTSTPKKEFSICLLNQTDRIGLIGRWHSEECHNRPQKKYLKLIYALMNGVSDEYSQKGVLHLFAEPNRSHWTYW
ncbi:CLUMA_CG008768, isoform A [Clunio marinus]|uniref:CLUMA_CG008768, isoform A n=1 Tax=Clunio marinus TaxID=568069 RepID=A0A1J1I554_9DIPT|nr:CLUMA_CG008768, isoform A [Clunio marinus]